MVAGVELSETLARIVEKVGPSAVRVEGRYRLPSTGIVWSSDGVIVTANHSVERDENVQVGLADGQTLTATIVGRDPTTDLAVLRVAASNLSQPSWSEATELKVGHLVLALGRPGKSARAALGIVSALGESWRTPSGGRLERYLQADFNLPPGFSGGPLVDFSGNVLGLNTSRLVSRYSLAVPTVTVRRVVEHLVAEGRVQRGFLGVGTFPIGLPNKLEQQLGQSSALLVIAVQPDGPADKGGLLLGDALVSIDGHALEGVDDLIAQLDGERVGTEVVLKVVRAGQIQDQRVTVGARS